MHKDNGTANSSDDEKKEPIIIVHGTSAAEATWWQPGSDFCKKLDAALANHGSVARCWDGLEELASDFKWAVKK